MTTNIDLSVSAKIKALCGRAFFVPTSWSEEDLASASREWGGPVYRDVDPLPNGFTRSRAGNILSGDPVNWGDFSKE